MADSDDDWGTWKSDRAKAVTLGEGSDSDANCSKVQGQTEKMPADSPPTEYRAMTKAMFVTHMREGPNFHIDTIHEIWALIEGKAQSDTMGPDGAKRYYVAMKDGHVMSSFYF